MKIEAFSWLEWGACELAFLGKQEAIRECEQALETLFGISRSELYLTAPSDPIAFSQFSEWVRARKERTPSAYLLRGVHFWDDGLEVEEGVFIPRPETEVLIESFFSASGLRKPDAFKFLDLGTGTGNIAVTMAKLFPNSRGAAVDLSRKALAVARRNARRLGVSDRLQFVQADGLPAFGKEIFDCVLSNPPYIASRDWPTLEPEVRREPRLALDGGEEGLDFYRKIFRQIDCLKCGGSLWVEIGWGERAQVQKLFEAANFHGIRIFKDFNQIERVICGIKFNG